MVISTDRLVFMALIAIGRITQRRARTAAGSPITKAVRLWWIPAISLVIVCVAQLNVHSLVPTLMHFFNAQIPALAEAARKARSPIAGPITDLMPLTRIGGWL